MKMNQSRVYETSLVLVTGFLVLYVVTKNELMIFISLFFGITGIFIKPLARLIAVGWFKLAEILNFFLSKIVFGILYFCFLWPISGLYKLANKDKLQLKPTEKSIWVERNIRYTKDHFEKIW